MMNVDVSTNTPTKAAGWKRRLSEREPCLSPPPWAWGAAAAGAPWRLLLRKPFISNAHRHPRQIHWDGEPPLIPLRWNGTEDISQD